MKRVLGAALGAALGAVVSCGGAESPPPAAAATRVFLIGIDGATWTRIDPLLRRGRMRATASLLREGSRASLSSLVPTVSPALWTTVATGKTFSKHGIADFTAEVPEAEGSPARIMHMTSNMRRTKALWNIAGDAGRRCAFVGWWVTWPAERVSGYMVTSHVPLAQTGGRARPTKGTLDPELGSQTWPEQLFEEIAPLIRSPESVTEEETERFMEIADGDADRDIVEGFRWAYSADETYRTVAAHLLDRDPDVELWGLYFNGVDVVEHRFWKYDEPAAYRPFDPEEIPRFGNVIDRYYEHTDRILAEIVARRKPGDVFLVVSDHGFHARGHRDGPDGVLIAAGRHIAPGVICDPAPELADVAPTALALLGIPAGADMDGRVLEELFTAEWRDAYPKERVPTWDTEEWQEQSPVPSPRDEELMERLRALGYVE